MQQTMIATKNLGTQGVAGLSKLMCFGTVGTPEYLLPPE